ncbi:MAG: potassium/proton antiporter [Acidimicrobiales bacterium]
MTPLASFVAAIRRRSRHGSAPRSRPDGRGGSAAGPSLVALVLGELRWSLAQALRPAPVAIGAAVAVGLSVALGPFTPGAVLADGWRLAIAAIVGVVASVAAKNTLDRRADDGLVAATRALIAVLALAVGATIAVSNLLAVVVPSTVDQPAVGATIDGSFPVDTPLLVGASLLVSAVVLVAAGSRTGFPGSLVFLALGLAVGSGGTGWLVVDDAQLVQQLAVAALVVILFEGGLTTSVDDLRRGAPAGVALATVGVAVTGGVVALGAVALLGLDAQTAMLIGAVVASTDAAAVFDLLRRAPLPGRIASALKIESGTNDPIAMLLTLTIVQSWTQPVSAWAAAAFGIVQLLGGLVIGAVLGTLGAAVVRRLPAPSEGLVGTFALGVGVLTYGLASAAGGSGLLATYIAGVVLAVEAPRRRRAFRSFLTALAGGVEIGLFLLLGLLADLGRLLEVAGIGLAITAILLVVARPLAVAAALTPLRFSARDQAAVGVLGLRGAVPVVLSTLVITSGIDDADTVFDVVFTVVVVATVAQSSIGPWLLRRLGVEPDRSRAGEVEALVADEAGVDLIEATLDPDSPLVGRTIAEADVPEGLLVGVVVRDGKAMIAKGGTRLAAGDRLVLVRTADPEGIAAVEAWVGPTQPA